MIPATSFARAIVRANQDPDKLGRVKVEYPWFHGEASQLPSEWARLCRPYASNGSGLWFLPEIGDEVFVCFENGNLDFPIVMGMLYSQKNQPPTTGLAGDGTADLKFIKTRSGHALIFDDAEGTVLLKDKKGNAVSIEAEKVTIRNAGGDCIVIKNGVVEIQAAGEIKLGKTAAQALVKGTVFQQLFNAHTHPTPTGSSGPPATPMTPDMLSQKVKTE